jgi:hypothetical protein
MFEWNVTTLQATGPYAVTAENDPMTKLAACLAERQKSGWEVFSVFARYNDITVVCRRKVAPIHAE